MGTLQPVWRAMRRTQVRIRSTRAAGASQTPNGDQARTTPGSSAALVLVDLYKNKNGDHQYHKPASYETSLEAQPVPAVIDRLDTGAVVSTVDRLRGVFDPSGDLRQLASHRVHVGTGTVPEVHRAYPVQSRAEIRRRRVE